jgi:hypothetical protein
MSDYEVVQKDTLEELKARVNFLLSVGYVTLGGIAVISDENERRFFQAMIKEQYP